MARADRNGGVITTATPETSPFRSPDQIVRFRAQIKAAIDDLRAEPDPDGAIGSFLAGFAARTAPIPRNGDGLSRLGYLLSVKDLLEAMEIAAQFSKARSLPHLDTLLCPYSVQQNAPVH